jgi:hypothetical protein
MIEPLLTTFRENPKTVIAAALALIAFGGTVARTEEAVKKVPKLEKAIVGIEQILAEQKGREEGQKEGQAEGEQAALKRICRSHPDLPECRELR